MTVALSGFKENKIYIAFVAYFGTLPIYNFQCSCVYLQLLYQHADSISSETVPQIFMKKKSKKYEGITFALNLFQSRQIAFSVVDIFLSHILFKQIFLTRIGIRSEDLEDFLEKTIKGSGISLSSPRLVIPAAIYGLWAVSHQYITSDLFDFQVSKNTLS